MILRHLVVIVAPHNRLQIPEVRIVNSPPALGFTGSSSLQIVSGADMQLRQQRPLPVLALYWSSVVRLAAVTL